MDEDKIFGKVISVYSLDQAIEDGVLVEVFKNRWQELSQGKPIVATAHLFNAVSLAALREIWNEYVDWRKNVCATLPEEDQLFSTTMNGEKVWLLEDGAAFTMLYPEDYLFLCSLVSLTRSPATGQLVLHFSSYPQ